MKSSILYVTAITSILLSLHTTFAATIHVDATNPNCPGNGTAQNPFCKIQDGISAAQNGDTVLVAPGTYVENIDFLGKAITVKSSAGAKVTTIDGNFLGPTVAFQNGEQPNSVLQGFTITNGSWGECGVLPALPRSRTTLSRGMSEDRHPLVLAAASTADRSVLLRRSSRTIPSPAISQGMGEASAATEPHL